MVQTDLPARIQKLKWNILGILNPNFFVWSQKGCNDTNTLRESGRKDYDKFLAEDTFLTSKKDFSKATVVEIGTGVGRITEHLASYFQSVYSVDISEAMLNRARKKLEQFSNVQLLQSNGMNFPLTSNLADVVFSFIVFQHFPTMEMVLSNFREVIRVLRPGGVAKIQVRGTKIASRFPTKLTWYYGVHVESEFLRNELNAMGADEVNITGIGQKYMWVTFSKKIT